MFKPFSWSHSALDQYQTCPFRYYKTRVSKEIVEPQTEAIIWGNRVHKALEENIKDNKPLEPEFNPYQSVLDSVRKIPGEFSAEIKFAVDRNLQPTDFHGPDAWCRCVTDLFIRNDPIAVAMDWKTGKIKYDFKQLELNALLIFAHYPKIEQVKGAYIWLKNKQVTKCAFNRSGPEAVAWNKYLTATTFMENSFKNNFWPKRRSGLCKNWCPVTCCEYNGKYRG